ncbi:hypothetical protein GCM10023175_71300 [Pseudonocardia xishanensis]|uniref:Helix-hairpin-helix DNA-binding motif class 1 domain-containing protein n=1 Tax=Pseudonocardia xishanensis TaxID=630995 RepID=A0ABP8S4U3_9PSEU
MLGTPVGPPYRRVSGVEGVTERPPSHAGGPRTARQASEPFAVPHPRGSAGARAGGPVASPRHPRAEPRARTADSSGQSRAATTTGASSGLAPADPRSPLPPVLRAAFPPPAGADAEPDTLPMDLGALRGDDPWAVFAGSDGQADPGVEQAVPLHAPGGRPGRVARLAERWVPAAWRGARLDPGRVGAVALVLVAAVAAIVAAVGVWSGRPRPEPLPALPSVSLAEPSPTPTAAAPAELVISVSGRVARPGLLRVPDGTRVAEAIEAAGGALPGTDLATLNLARRVADGEQIAVGVPPAPDAGGASAGGAQAAGPGDRVDLNRATLEQLDGLPGVGPVTAQRILDWRAAHGRFARVDQLREIEGIGERRFAQLEGLVAV